LKKKPKETYQALMRYPDKDMPAEPNQSNSNVVAKGYNTMGDEAAKRPMKYP
jgi:hypothetical protein